MVETRLTSIASDYYRDSIHEIEEYRRLNPLCHWDGAVI